jgi:hypothetical protein
MKTWSLTLAAAAALSLGAAAPALADSYEQIVNRRQANQEQRSDQGIRSGELNRREAARLENAQNAQSQRIYRQKHDRQSH